MNRISVGQYQVFQSIQVIMGVPDEERERGGGKYSKK